MPIHSIKAYCKTCARVQCRCKPMTMERRSTWHHEKDDPTDQDLKEMALRKYEVITQQFNEIVDWIANGHGPVNERHSEIRIYLPQ